MSGYFVLKDAITDDLLRAISEQAPQVGQLEELLSRESNCDYKAQLIDDLQTEANLYTTIYNDVRRSNTNLRLYLLLNGILLIPRKVLLNPQGT